MAILSKWKSKKENRSSLVAEQLASSNNSKSAPIIITSRDTKRSASLRKKQPSIKEKREPVEPATTTTAPVTTAPTTTTTIPTKTTTTTAPTTTTTAAASTPRSTTTTPPPPSSLSSKSSTTPVFSNDTPSSSIASPSESANPAGLASINYPSAKKEPIEAVINSQPSSALSLDSPETQYPPRVGHASLTLGNAFIIFGGDTKTKESDILDSELYLLNTTALKWTTAGIPGRKPTGRYGHTISTVGSVLYVFGGQLNDTFFDDLISYDLTTLQSPSSHWNFIKPTSPTPPGRTNHTVITHNDKLYLFGGTDGKNWYNDTWCYDPAFNTWKELNCTGFIPEACEGHAATIVGDIMYVFGGRSRESKDLGLLSALIIPSQKWFNFQNMGPGPSPRSGHSMTAFDVDKIIVMGGESPAVSEHDTINKVFVLDTSKINYPPNAIDLDEEAKGLSGVIQNDPKEVQNKRAEKPKLVTKLPISMIVDDDDDDDKTALSNSESCSPSDDMSQPDGSASPFSLDTVRADSVDPKDASDLSLRQILEQLKASNSWYESELAAARESGYVPSSRPPVDVLKLRRVSQLVSQDTDKSLSERTILIEALSDLKSELNQVQNSIQSQAEQASAKIAEAETDRDNAYKRTQLLEEQLKASDNREISRNSISEEREEELLERISTLEKELSDQVKLKEVLFGKATSQDLETNLQLFDMEKIRSDNISLEQQLRTFSDRNILAQHEASRYKSQLESMLDRYKTLEKSTEVHVKSLGAASIALSAAQSKSGEYSNLLAQRNNERAELKNEVISLRSELETVKEQYQDALRDLEASRVLLAKSTEQGNTAATALTEGIDKVVTMWMGARTFRRAATRERRRSMRSRDSVAAFEDMDALAAAANGTDPYASDDPEIAQLQKQLNEITQLYENNQRASDVMAREMTELLEQVSLLKQELISSEKSRYNDSLIEELRKRLDETEEKYMLLENEYDGSLQYVHNSDKALIKTRDELVRYKELNNKLQGEIDDLKLRTQDEDETGSVASLPEDMHATDGTSSVASGGSNVRLSRTDFRRSTPPYNSRQFDLQLRDLRAQVIILQEERDELRNSTLEAKKRLINNNEDLRDAQLMIEQLEREVQELKSRLKA
ncbi:hypothetical protein DV451_004242 [Geotrichum candidum]|uniref:Uncharacterized protein n=1 Tax=Geotrichum candidum TaxID=1173061 RepID=A0A9P5G141_GEOCN|nr:hypothetical protein DV451_004242 [Geotrichum candidum]KAF5107955.1 hypothetical protein DV453_002685 [Geotrichum candidum]